LIPSSKKEKQNCNPYLLLGINFPMLEIVYVHLLHKIPKVLILSHVLVAH
jgi:hypothetical protein